MALRFRKSFKLAPGVRLNVSKSGMSWSLGPRGASVSIGKRGAYFNASIPGTGLSARVPLGQTSPRPQQQLPPSTPVTVTMTVQVGEDGVVRYVDANGNPVSDTLIVQAKRQQGDVIRALLQRKCDEVNAQISALGELHVDTPRPTAPRPFEPLAYEARRPIPPIPVRMGMLDRLIPSRRRAAEEKGAQQEANFQQAVLAHDREVAAHAKRNADARMEYSAALAGNPGPMEVLLERRLSEIVWPKETLVAIEIANDGASLMLDVDLPEVEDMPTMRATLPARGWELSLRAAGEVATRKLYQQHIHAVAFRLIGETFAALPTIGSVVLSGYSQRVNAATGHTNDEYLYSLRVNRDEWRALNFDALHQIDVVEALGRFELRRNMTVTGIFRAISPLNL
jgi:hypothetical protein